MNQLNKHKYIRNKLVNIAIEDGYIKDDYFNTYNKVINDIEFRFIFNTMSYKMQYKISTKWIKIFGTYYKNLYF